MDRIIGNNIDNPRTGVVPGNISVFSVTDTGSSSFIIEFTGNIGPVANWTTAMISVTNGAFPTPTTGFQDGGNDGTHWFLLVSGDGSAGGSPFDAPLSGSVWTINSTPAGITLTGSNTGMFP